MEIKQDINFLDKPLWFQTDKSSGDKKFTWKDIDGYVYCAGYKLPEKMDILFLLYILLKAQQAGYQQKMSFTRYEILKECGLSTDSKAYNRLKDGLSRWLHISITFNGTFYDGKKYKEIGFHIIDSYEINENTGKLEVSLNPLWLAKIKDSEFFKYINFHYYKALKRPVSRRLYEVLCKTFKGREYWKIDLVKLGKKLTLSGKKVLKNGMETEVLYPNIVLASIKPAINEINWLAEDKKALDALEVKANNAFKIKYRLSEDKKVITFEKVLPDWVSKGFVEKKESSEEKPKESKRETALEELLEMAKSKTKGIKEALDEALKEKGFEYVKWNILYANKEAKKNYSVFLKKSLKEDWGAEVREQEGKREEAEKALQEKKAKEKEEVNKAYENLEELKKAYEALEHKEILRLEPLALKRCLEMGMPRNYIPKITLMNEIVAIHQEENHSKKEQK